MQTNPERDDTWTTTATTCGYCIYNDHWIIYRMDSAPTVDISTAWTSQVVDTIPVAPRLAYVSSGFFTNNLTSPVQGELRIETNKQVKFTTYTAPFSGQTVPFERFIVMPR